MKLSNALNRTLAATLLASTCLVAFAPVAQAGHGRFKRYRGQNRYVQHVVYRDSGAGPALAGLIGGFILGTAVSNARVAPPPPVVVRERVYAHEPHYRYYDPYCDQWFVSLSMVSDHCCDVHHPRIVRVYDGYEGPCVRSLRWSGGGWYDYEDEDWRD